ncbi:MAG: hypothetical protein ACTSXT_11750 [Candidatus Helarchaeota archaeon]
MENKFRRLINIIDIVIQNIESTSFSLYNDSLGVHNSLLVQFKNIMNNGIKILPDHQDIFSISYQNAGNFTKRESINMLKHIKELIEIENIAVEKIEELKLFESAEEKIKQASISFRNEQYTSVLHNLNSAVELALKEKLDIPVTIPSINTTKIIEILVNEKIGPYAYFNEVKKRVTFIDNKVKHQGYLPSKIESLNAIKSTTDLLNKLKPINIKLTNEVKNKIYQGL